MTDFSAHVTSCLTFWPLDGWCFQDTGVVQWVSQNWIWCELRLTTWNAVPFRFYCYNFSKLNMVLTWQLLSLLTINLSAHVLTLKQFYSLFALVKIWINYFPCFWRFPISLAYLLVYVISGPAPIFFLQFSLHFQNSVVPPNLITLSPLTS